MFKINRMNSWLSKIPPHLERFLNSSFLVNWTPLKKTILILILGANDCIKWMVWLIWSAHSEHVQQWINLDYYPTHLYFLITSFIGFWFFIWLCTRYKSLPLIQQYMPLIATSYLAGVYLYGGYAIGIMSPASIAGYVSIVTLGFVLFNRLLVYKILIPFTLILLTLIILSAFKLIPYSVLFNQNIYLSPIHHNIYWVFSMMFLYIPIYVASLTLLELLLLHWRNREALITEISQKDALTGIYNRRSVNDDSQKRQDSGQAYSVILLDIDFFKKINDNYGHHVGDHILKQVAKILSKSTRSSDVLGRYGGEEFIIILTGNQLDEALEIAERCRTSIAEEVFMIDQSMSLKITASFGVAISQDSVTCYEEIIKLADQALYLAKDSGRNQVKSHLDLINTQ